MPSAPAETDCTRRKRRARAVFAAERRWQTTASASISASVSDEPFGITTTSAGGSRSRIPVRPRASKRSANHDLHPASLLQGTRVLRKLAVTLLAAGAVGVAIPELAQAGDCGLPDATPLWVDFAARDLHDVFARPGVVLATSTGEYPSEVRAAGARTIYWDMYLRNRVGTPDAPANPATLEERAQRLHAYAAAQTACPTPWIVLNELFGANLVTPWSASNAQYRTNVLEFLRVLARQGSRPLLLISRPPYTGTADAAAWWREVAKVSYLLPEVFFSAPILWREGAIAANRRIRIAFRRAVGNLTAIGIPVSRIGLTLGFQVARGAGGREGLRPTEAWLETVKWQTLAAKQVAAEMKIATVVSWGWGTWSAASTDPDKPWAACVYLWARSANLCDAPAAVGERFNASRTEGQLIVPPGVQCRVGPSTIRMDAIARLNRLTGDRDVALSALYGRLAEGRDFTVAPSVVRSVERSIVSSSFGGSRAAYGAALGRVGVGLREGRAIIADQLRRRRIGRGLPVPAPSGVAVSTFYTSYPEVLARSVQVSRSPWWLGGRKRGLAIAAFAPPSVFTAPAGRSLVLQDDGPYSTRVSGEVRELGSVPFGVARESIAAGLRGGARDDAARAWSARKQRALLHDATCRRDHLPFIGPIDLTGYLPFLMLRG
jgi:hypothetical protein